MRVLTLNVHDPDDRKLPGLAALLDESGAELIALTECRRRSAEALAERLGCVGFAHVHAPYWGNALLTRTLEMDPGPAIDLPPSRLGETRSAAVGAVHGTRVDYVLVGRRCQLQPVARSYRVLSAMERGLSDHDAVSVELALAPAA